MAITNPSTFPFFLVGIYLLVCCCPASSRTMDSDSDAGSIKGDVVSSSPTARQILMPAIYPYTAGLVTNYQQQQTPPNFFHQWLHAPSNIPTVSSDDKFDDETSSSVRQQQKYPCGRGPATLPQRTAARIVGGSEAVKNSWPFMVGLRYNGTLKCGGSLISPVKVLTSARCVERYSSFDISLMSVSLGMHTVGRPKFGTENDAQMTRRVSRVAMHNGFITINAVLANDIAILTLESPVVYSDAISPVCLAPPSTDPDQYAGEDAVMIGWGRTSQLPASGAAPDTLQQASIGVITNAKCKETTPVTSFTFCLQSPNKGTCTSDSGGPIIVQSETGAWTQIGIVGYRSSTCGVLPSIITRVPAYRNWIAQNSQ